MAERGFLAWDLLKTAAVSAWSVLWIVLALVLRLVTGRTRIPLAMARNPWAWGVLRITGFRVEVHGAEGVDWSRPHFVVANHQSFLDVPVLFQAIPVGLHFVVKSELRKAPFLSWYIAAMGMIFVDRSRPESARQSIRDTAAAALAGKTVVLFPEGTRSRDGKLRPLKPGMLGAAIEGSTPILPVYIEGTGEGMAPARVPRYRPRTLRVWMGAPFSTDGYATGERRKLAQDVGTELRRLRDRSRGAAVES